MVETSDEADVYQYAVRAHSWTGPLRDSYGEAMSDAIALIKETSQRVEILQVQKSDGTSVVYRSVGP